MPWPRLLCPTPTNHVGTLIWLCRGREIIMSEPRVHGVIMFGSRLVVSGPRLIISGPWLIIKGPRHNKSAGSQDDNSGPRHNSLVRRCNDILGPRHNKLWPRDSKWGPRHNISGPQRVSRYDYLGTPTSYLGSRQNVSGPRHNTLVWLSRGHNKSGPPDDKSGGPT